jgi:D-glycero-alpha-D-manno-heptose-7-phosphate kinase
MTTLSRNAVIRARAPLRLGLAGGGTDVSPYCDRFGGYVLNATIDRYAYATVEVLEGRDVEFIAAERDESWRGPLCADIGAECSLALHRAVYNRFVREFGGGTPLPIRLTTFADAPAGSGLGSSSAMVVCMVCAMQELLNVPFGEYELARLSYVIEREDVGLAGGRQDQYAASFGGINFMEFYPGSRVLVNPLRVKPWIIAELEASMILYFTGASRESAKIIQRQQDNTIQGLDEALEAMHAVKQDAVLMKEAILRGDFVALTEALAASWEAKKRMAQGITNPLIEAAFNAAIAAGASAGKVSGAGGGGFILFLAPPHRRITVTKALEALGGVASGCHFTKHGAQSWRVT